MSSDDTTPVERMLWSGVCTDCGTGHIVFPTIDQTPEQQREVSETWPRGLAECATADCDGTIDWNGNDPIDRAAFAMR